MLHDHCILYACLAISIAASGCTVTRVDVTHGNACWHAVCEWVSVCCGHTRFCERCAHRVTDMGSRCPLCRTNIATFMRVFP